MIGNSSKTIFLFTYILLLNFVNLHVYIHTYIHTYIHFVSKFSIKIRQQSKKCVFCLFNAALNCLFFDIIMGNAGPPWLTQSQVTLFRTCAKSKKLKN
jgi:hypothetical protein